MNNGEESIHMLRYFSEVRGMMIPYIYRLFTIATAKLGNVRNRSVI